MVAMAIRDDRASPADIGRPLEALLNELDCNTLDVVAYVTDLQEVERRVDSAGAACIGRRLELLDDLGDRLDDGPRADLSPAVALVSNSAVRARAFEGTRPAVAESARTGHAQGTTCSAARHAASWVGTRGD